MRGKKGFTLIEMLISMAILSIVMFSFFSILNNSIVMNKKTEVDIKGMNIAQSSMEEIRSDIKSGRTIGIDLNEDGVDDITILSSNWDSNEGLVQEYNNNDITGSVESGNIQYEIHIKGLKRERKSLTSNRYLYTVNISVNKIGKDYSIVDLTNQIYTP